MLLRATHSPPIATPALRLSLIPAFNILSPSPSSTSVLPRRHSTFAPSKAPFPTKTLVVPNSTHLPSFSVKRVPGMISHPCPKATASFSVGSGSGGDREILVQHLLVKEDDLKLLVELQKRISEGEDLSDLAVEYSICPSKEEGGMLGWVRKGQMVPEFEEAAFSAPVNKVVKCKTKFGWHLLQVVSEREEAILQDIQPDEFHQKMQDPCFIDEAQLIDVREPEEVAQASLPSFQVLPLRQFGSWGPEITDKFDCQKDTYVLGFQKVFNVAGGIHAYALKADPSVPTY